MADSRINLLSSASSSASDDFFVVDGTTNGTRKLNAFSPTFGGNATVTGTLTVNGGTTLNATLVVSSNVGTIGKSGTGTGGNWRFVSDDGTTRWLSGILGGAGETSFSIYDIANSRSLLTATAAGVVQINQTTASTTTSTGALVVGNGTSGGLGVGGAVNIGGKLAVGAAVLSDRMFYVSGSTGTTGASQFSAVVNPTIPNTVTTGAYGLYLGTNIAAGATVTNSYSLYVASPDYTGSTITNKYGLYSADTNPSYFAGKVSIAATTASTTTSSGALVVSGGVGVGKQIVAAEDIVIDPTDASPENLAPEAAFCRSVGLATSSSVLAFGSDARVGLLRGYQDGGNLVEWRFGSYIGSTFNEQMRLGGTSATSSSLTLYGTTASNSTSSGALVVSGGVGVAGAINAGGTITSTNGSGSGLLGMRSSSGNASYVFWSETGVADRGILGFNNGSSTLSYRSFSSSFSTGTEVFSITSAGVVSIPATTASTSTSSGALVVSGGVGVAGAVFSGGAFTCAVGAGFNTPDWRFYQSGTSGYVRDLVNGQMALQFVSGNASTIQVYATGTQDSTSTTSGSLVSSGGLGVAGAVNVGTFYGLVDGVPAPSTAGGYARIYVDSADGDLKVKFGDGTVKTIATDS